MEYVEAQETAEYSFLKNFRQLVTLERQKVPTAYLKSQKGNGRVAQTKGPRQDAGTRNPSITFLRHKVQSVRQPSIYMYWVFESIKG